MRVGVDATSWTNRRGYGRFARNAVRRLVERDTATTYVLYIDEQSADGTDLPPGAERRLVKLSTAPSRAAAADSRRSIGDLVRIVRAARGGDVDVFLFPSVYTYFPVPGVPTLVGVHDDIADRFAELTLPTRRARAAWRAKEAFAVRRATRLFTVSEASRGALAERFRLRPGDLAVVPEAPDPVFSPRGPLEVADALAGIGLARDARFFLFAGGISPHKNLDTLLDAYAALVSRRREAPALVLVGDLDSDPYLSAATALRDRIRRLRIDPQVHLPGFVSDDALACLYSGATAVVLPSLAEGFGLPAVEAAACGAPVLLSEIPAHRETLGEAALYFPPKDVAALETALGRVLDEPGLRDSLATRSREAVAPLSWDAAAERLRALLVEAAGR